jgi:hypothetical protein
VAGLVIFLNAERRTWGSRFDGGLMLGALFLSAIQ